MKSQGCFLRLKVLNEDEKEKTGVLKWEDAHAGEKISEKDMVQKKETQVWKGKYVDILS